MEYQKIYGTSTKISGKINMCGGCAEWWNYILFFNSADSDSSYSLFIEDSLGLKRIEGYLVYHIDEEEVRVADDSEDYDPDSEMLIDYDWFDFE